MIDLAELNLGIFIFISYYWLENNSIDIIIIAYGKKVQKWLIFFWNI